MKPMKAREAIKRTIDKRKPCVEGSSSKPPEQWEWADSKAVVMNVATAIERAARQCDGTPYSRLDVTVRRIIYRVGCAGLRTSSAERFFGDARAMRTTPGRQSKDIFAVLLRLALPLLKARFEGTELGLSDANIKKHAMMMRAAFRWDIYWRYYDFVVSGVGAQNMSRASKGVDHRPAWADGLTRTVQVKSARARQATEPDRSKKIVKKNRQSG